MGTAVLEMEATGTVPNASSKIILGVKRMKEKQLNKKKWIPNKKERDLVWTALGMAFLIVFLGSWYYHHAFPQSFNTRTFKGVFKEFGSYARLPLLFVFSHYVLTVILRKKIVKNLVRTITIKLLKLTRQWHVPVAILSLALVTLHVIGVFLYGFRLDFSYVSGLIALIVLIPVPISGLFRYRKLDKKWHWTTGLIFTLLFLIHSF
ncbi:hypothetical protein LC085_21430 [Bacillus tianshenii]|uniref:hypothetical protein n=1 Tax=Sutcliffiella tianshenii TaxID=1463404 RepID=UPI001CD38920|nr:hypothetical protein [Bacillus tianshenii]MCA1322441.1 hypothetical protein [Bacillus tianshenii]